MRLIDYIHDKQYISLARHSINEPHSYSTCIHQVDYEQLKHINCLYNLSTCLALSTTLMRTIPIK